MNGFWELESIRRTLEGVWVVEPRGPGRAGDGIPGVSTDSRSIAAGQLFVALRGEKLDGHDYLQQAASSGAGALVIDSPAKVPASCVGAGGREVPILRVGNTGDALLRLASAWRAELATVPVVAVTGSNGKTTTTRLVEAVLSRLGRGTASIKSFNNRIGVPLTILRARADDRFLVCEVGTNAIGEIAELAAVVRPDVTVITSIGREHLEGLGGLEGSAGEAVWLMREQGPGGTAIVPAGIPELERAIAGAAAANPGVSVVRFGESGGADLRVSAITGSDEGVKFCLDGVSWFHVPLIGRHNAMNAAAAVAVGRKLGLDDEAIGSALAGARGAEMRLERRRIVLGPGTAAVEIINDAYNANPESMLAGIQTFKDLYGGRTAGRRIGILGDMLELGEHGPDCHREIGDAVVASGVFDECVLVGPLMMFAAERIGRGIASGRVTPVPGLDDAAAARIAGMVRPGDALLVKGSRGMGLERIIKALERRSVA